MSLPIGFRRVEYIESFGEQYIDPCITHNSSDKFLLKMVMEYTTTSPANQIMGFNGNAGNGIGTSGDVWWEIGSSVKANTRYDVSWSVEGNSYSRTINGTIHTGNRTVKDFKSNMYLFAAMESSTAQNIMYYCYSRLYEAEIQVNNTIVRNLIPCIAINEVGLYDDVNGVFYGNAGSGAFLAGPYTDECSVYGFENVGGVLKRYIDCYENVGGVLKKILYGYQNVGGLLIPLGKKLFGWKKYTTIETNEYSVVESTTTTRITKRYNDDISCASTVAVDEETLSVVLVDQTSVLVKAYTEDREWNTYPYFVGGNGKVAKYTGDSTSGVNRTITGNLMTAIKETFYSMGTYIEDVTSENENAYPDNGRHTDGYWYVKQA